MPRFQSLTIADRPEVAQIVYKSYLALLGLIDEAEEERERVESVSDAELQRRLRETLSRPIPDPEESAARAKREFVPLTGFEYDSNDFTP